MGCRRKEESRVWTWVRERSETGREGARGLEKEKKVARYDVRQAPRYEAEDTEPQQESQRSMDR